MELILYSVVPPVDWNRSVFFMSAYMDTQGANDTTKVFDAATFSGFYIKSDRKLIPEQLVAYFLSFLPFSDVFNSSIVSKYLLKCSRMVTIVNVVDFGANFQTSNLRKILNRFDIIKSLTIDDCNEIDNELLADIVARAQSATAINFQNFFSRDLRALIILNGFFQQLQSLKLSGISFLKKETRTFVSSCMTNMLRVVHLNGFRTIDGEDIKDVFANAPNLEEACFEDCTQVNVVRFEASSLRRLSFARCVCLTSIHVSNLSSLENLDISNCRSLEAASFNKLVTESNLKNLVSINMGFCSKVSTVAISGENPMPYLESMDLEGCTSLTSVNLTHVPSLSIIKLGMCLELQRINLVSASIINLDMSMLPTLTEVTLDCKNLKKFDCAGSKITRDAVLATLETER